MPSGAYIRADSHSGGLFIYLYGLPEDQQLSSGMCGNFDGDVQNDLRIKGTDDFDPSNGVQNPIPRQFTESYR